MPRTDSPPSASVGSPNCAAQGPCGAFLGERSAGSSGDGFDGVRAESVGTEKSSNNAQIASSGDDRTSRTSFQRLWESLQRAWRTSRYSVKAISSYPSNISMKNFADGMPCHHTHREKECIIYVFKGLVRGLLVGFGMRSAFISALSIFSRKLYLHPLQTLKHIFGPDSFRFGVFLGSMNFVYRILQCLFCKLRGRPGKSNNALAGFIAGFTILLDKRDRRTTIAVYLLVRALYELARTLAYNKTIPNWEYGNAFVFALCQIPIMYSFLREPQHMNPGYYKWILSMGRVTPQILHHVAGIDQKVLNPCQPVYHTGSCWAFHARDWPHGVFVRASRIYLPVHIIPGLVFKRKYVVKNPLGFLRDALVGVFRSSLFLGTYTSTVKSGICWTRHWFGLSSPALCLVGFLTGLSLLFEHRKRHAELMQYCVPRALEIVFNMYESRRSFPPWFAWLRTTGLGDVLLFCAAVATFVHCADTMPRLKSINASVFRLIFGPGTQMLAAEPHHAHGAGRIEDGGEGAAE